MSLSSDDFLRLANAAGLGADGAVALKLFYDSIQDRVEAVEEGFVSEAPHISVIDHGAVGDGVTDDRVAIQAALAAAALLGQTVYFPPGVYMVSRFGSAAYCLDMPGNNIAMVGVRNASWIKQVAGLPDASISTLRLNQRDNIKISNLGFDGNWGNSVGGTDDNVGINHTTQVDPKNHAIQIRGSTNVTISDVSIKQQYGDGIWVGHGATTPSQSENVHIERVTVDLVARHAVTYIWCDNVSVRDCSFTNIYAGTVDTEPVTTFKTSRNITLDKCHIGRWWSDAVIRFPLSIVGADSTAHDFSAARGFRVTNCVITGPTIVSSAYDVVFDNCRFICDYDTESYAPLYIDHIAKDVTVQNCYIYDRATPDGDAHLGAITIRHYGTTIKPERVKLVNVTIDARNTNAGIAVEGAGGTLGDTGTATSVVNIVGPPATYQLIDTSKSWTEDQFQGSIVRMGGLSASISSNTEDTLNLFGWAAIPSALPGATPPDAGAYEIMAQDCEVVIENCFVNCSDDGNGQGGVGLYLDAGDIGAKPCRAQVKVRNLTVRNADTDAVFVKSRNVANPWHLLVLDGIHAKDDQVTPTCATAVRFDTANAVNITKIVMRGIMVDGVAARLAGVGAASPNLIRWVVNDGDTAEWAGYGTPESAVTATKGATFHRKDGGSATCFYVKESDTTNTGWVAK